MDTQPDKKMPDMRKSEAVKLLAKVKSRFKVMTEFDHENRTQAMEDMKFVNVPGEQWEERTVRFRTIGDATCTGATESTAATLEDIIAEVAAARQTERGGRSDDKRSEAAMEDRKKQGYF